MGVPNLYRWLSERYPMINRPIDEALGMPEIDNFYLDANGILHKSTHGDAGEAAAHARVQGPPSVTVLLYGETFRIGQQGTRYTETPESIQPQLNATASQMENLILPLKRSGFRVTCFVGTNASEAGLEAQEAGIHPTSRA